MKNYNLYLILFLALGFTACEPEIDDKSDIGPAPTASFEILAGDTPNDFVLRNTTDGAFLTNWDLGTAGMANGEEVTAEFSFRGDYEVKMTTFNRGGSASVTKTVTVTQDDPNSCVGNLKLLTGCNEKIWKLAPEAGALNVGMSIDHTWWASNDGDVDTRACTFDDQYIFRSNGEFEYKNNGDFWADSDSDGNIWPGDLGVAVGCQPESALPAAYASWGSGLHDFNVTDANLTVIGEGAWIGLYKLGTTGEVGTPQSSVSFNINSLTEERMVLVADYGGTVWRVTLVSE